MIQVLYAKTCLDGPGHPLCPLLVDCVPGGHESVGGPGQHEHHHVDDRHLQRPHQALLLPLI